MHEGWCTKQCGMVDRSEDVSRCLVHETGESASRARWSDYIGIVCTIRARRRYTMDQRISARYTCALPDARLEEERLRLVALVHNNPHDATQTAQIIISIIEREQRARATLAQFLAPEEMEYPVSDGIC